MNDDIYKPQNFGNEAGLCREPALFTIDFQVGFTAPEGFGRGNVSDAIAATIPLLAASRRLRLPVANSRAVFSDDGTDAGMFELKFLV